MSPGLDSAWRRLRRAVVACLAMLLAAAALEGQSSRVILVRSASRSALERRAHEQVSAGIAAALALGTPRLELEVRVLEAGGNAEAAFWRRIGERNPSLVITVGTPATRSAAEHLRGIPLIYSMVLEGFRPGPAGDGLHDIGGTTLAITPEEQLKVMLLALPGIRRIGLICSNGSAGAFRAAARQVESRGIRLVTAEIASERDIVATLRRVLPEVDALWLPPESITYEQHNLRYILQECFQNGVPIIAVSRQVAEAGAPLALGIDYEDLGRQTAELALQRLSRGPSPRPVEQHPRRVLLFINEGVADRLGLEIPEREGLSAVRLKSGGR